MGKKESQIGDKEKGKVESVLEILRQQCHSHSQTGKLSPLCCDSMRGSISSGFRRWRMESSELKFVVVFDFVFVVLCFCRCVLIATPYCARCSMVVSSMGADMPDARKVFDDMPETQGVHWSKEGRAARKDFKIQNIVASCDIKFPIRLERDLPFHTVLSQVHFNVSFPYA
ncbi:hypothetical protein Droror1_Dr00006664 [Drosera rotundifolia]